MDYVYPARSYFIKFCGLQFEKKKGTKAAGVVNVASSGSFDCSKFESDDFYQ